jgi:MarR family 2-MHQ and catechol resistance regulon transcriptional repressor
LPRQSARLSAVPAAEPAPSGRRRTAKVPATVQERRGINDVTIEMGGDSAAVVAYVSLHHASDLVIKAAERNLASFNLSVARYAILRMLTGRGAMPSSWIADKHFSRQSNITAMVDRLVRDGLVRRVPDAADRRVTRVELTPRGQNVVKSARPPHLEFLNTMMSALSEKEQMTLVKLLDKLAARLDQ